MTWQQFLATMLAVAATAAWRLLNLHLPARSNDPAMPRPSEASLPSYDQDKPTPE